jgi:predicted nucleotidyltransferase
MSAPDTSALIERAGRALLEAASSPAKVVLFGSRARGEADEGSAFDFLVIEKKVDDRESETAKLRGALRHFEAPMNVVVMDAAQVEGRAKLPGTMVGRVLGEGRVIAES